MRILIVEDEAKVARALQEGLAGEGFESVVAGTGEDGFFRASSETFDLELLEYLLRHAGRHVSREMLAREVWKEPDRATPLDNVIDVHVARLRKKVDLERERKLLHTVRGIGFMVSENAP